MNLINNEKNEFGLKKGEVVRVSSGRNFQASCELISIIFQYPANSIVLVISIPIVHISYKIHLGNSTSIPVVVIIAVRSIDLLIAKVHSTHSYYF